MASRAGALLVVLALAVALFLWYRSAPEDEVSHLVQVRDGAPSWSADGSRIVFHSDRDGNGEIYLMNADGSGIERLTRHPASDGYPCWSPDQKKILFDSDRGGNFDIWLMNADGSDPRPLTDNPARELAAAWSPDGEQIAYMSDLVGAFQIYVMNADGSAPQRMTMIYSNWFPRWSPDGTRLAFHVERDVHILQADASALTRLTTDPLNGMYPSWSPDGARIAFMSWRDGNTEIYTMAADGADQTRLTRTEVGDSIDPRWSPDGSQIVFVRVPSGGDGDGPQQIWVVDASGGEIRQLTGG